MHANDNYWLEIEWERDEDGDICSWLPENMDMVSRVFVPGVQLKHKKGGLFLIGNLNRNGGTCGCCDIDWREFTHHRTVVDERVMEGGE